MKNELFKILTFVCMVIVLSFQELLKGSWKVPEIEAENGNQTSRS